MRWIKPSIRTSLYGLLGYATPATVAKVDRVEIIRTAMLGTLSEQDKNQFPHLDRRLRFATDVMELWYLRGDLMQSLASLRGESAARDAVHGFTPLFHGMVPKSMVTAQRSRDH